MQGMMLVHDKQTSAVVVQFVMGKFVLISCHRNINRLQQLVLELLDVSW